MADYKVDYHIHSCYSDGTLNPVDIVQKYHDEKYDEIALTDHDTIEGLNEFLIAGKALKIQVVPGIELDTDYKGHALHILGYKFDMNDEKLKNSLDKIKGFRQERNKKMIAKLQEMGYNITLDEVRTVSKGDFVGKPHIADMLLKKGYIKDEAEAFAPGQILESPEIKAIKKTKLSAKEAISLINNAKGMAVLAHPSKIKSLGERNSQEFWDNLYSMLRELKQNGLKGLECIYPTHTKEEETMFIEMASKLHLHITKGSDFHGRIHR